MSFILTLEMDKLEQILEILPKYEQKVKDAEVVFELEGRKLEEIARTLPHHQQNYGRAYQEMKALAEWLQNVKEKETAKLWKKYVEGYPKQLSTRDIQAYIAGEKVIVELNQIIIEVDLTKNHLYEITENLRNMGWMVGHITKLRVSELQETVL
jgi:uncharacterized coiled-coil protein SlyX